MPIAEEECTRDALFGGALHLWQRKKGYRFGLDSLLLATDLPDLSEGSVVLELGAGQGAVCLTVAKQRPDVQVVALERQASLLELLRRNVEENELQNVAVVAGDLRDHRQILAAHSADLVLANPPFFREGDRRPPADEERAGARHELHGGVQEFITAAAYALKQRGALQMITPPLRLSECLVAAEGTSDLALESLRFFHSRQDEEAYLVQYRWRRGGAADVKVRPPLVVYAGDGTDYSDEVATRLQRRGR